MNARFGYDQGVFGGLITNEDFLDIVDHPSEGFLGFIGMCRTTMPPALNIHAGLDANRLPVSKCRATTSGAFRDVSSTSPSVTGWAEGRLCGLPWHP